MNTNKLIGVLILELCAAIILQSAQPVPESVSNAGKASLSGASGSFASAFSADGRFILFSSYSRNLTTNDLQGDSLNIYLKEMSSGQISLVSLAANGIGGGNNSSYAGSISSNGQFVAFESSASNLVPNDTNGFKDVFVRDRVSGATILLSIDAAGAGPANGDSSNPIISPDGRFVAFESSASNLVANETNSLRDVFVRDRQTGITVLASAGASGTPGSAHDSSMHSELAGM